MRQIEYTRTALYIQALFIGACVNLFLFTPEPNVAVDVLAVGAIVLAVRAVAKGFNKTEQIVWILIAVALCSIEFRAIKKDEADREDKEASIRWQDDFNRKQERRQFSTLIDSGNKLLSTEERVSKTTMNALTGGESFCYVDLHELAGSHGMLLGLLLQKGQNPVFNVEVEVIDLDFIRPVMDIAKARTTFSFPFVRVGSYATQLFETMPAVSAQSKSYSVFVTARNGRFTERLRLRRVNGSWLSAKRVDASYYSKKIGLVLEEMDKGFPVEILDSDSDWKAVDKLKRITIH
jgi:hypothetical protein